MAAMRLRSAFQFLLLIIFPRTSFSADAVSLSISHNSMRNRIPRRARVNQAVANIPGSRVLLRRDGFLLVEIPGGPAEASSLLRTTLNSGLVVEHFDARGPGLEERYCQAFGERLS